MSDAVLRDVERQLIDVAPWPYNRFSSQDVARMLLAAARCSECDGTGSQDAEVWGYPETRGMTKACYACNGTGIDSTRLDAALKGEG